MPTHSGPSRGCSAPRPRVQKYALDFQTLAIIEVAVFAVFEYKRYQNFKKDGHVRTPRHPTLSNASACIPGAHKAKKNPKLKQIPPACTGRLPRQQLL